MKMCETAIYITELLHVNMLDFGVKEPKTNVLRLERLWDFKVMGL